MATWAALKAQARDMLGITLTDADVVNVPLLATDAYGNFIKGPNGFPQVVMAVAETINGVTTVTQHLVDDVRVARHPQRQSGGADQPVRPTIAVRTGHQFLIDVAHNADAVRRRGQPLQADADDVVGRHAGAPAFYDDELLDAHYMAGDGRVNENIGLTAVHAIFHSEHNRLVDQTKERQSSPTRRRSPSSMSGC